MSNAIILVLLTTAVMLTDIAFNRRLPEPAKLKSKGAKMRIFIAVCLLVLILMSLLIRSINDLLHCLFFGLWAFVMVSISRSVKVRLYHWPRPAK